MSEVPKLLQSKDYSKCVATMRKAGAKYKAGRLTKGIPVSRSSDQLTQIIHHEDVTRKSQTKSPKRQVGKWACMEAERLYQQSMEQHQCGNLHKAQYLATECVRSFDWAKHKAGARAAEVLLRAVEREIAGVEQEKLRQAEEDAAKPNAEEVNIKFKSLVMGKSVLYCKCACACACACACVRVCAACVNA